MKGQERKYKNATDYEKYEYDTYDTVSCFISQSIGLERVDYD